MKKLQNQNTESINSYQKSLRSSKKINKASIIQKYREKDSSN